MATTTNYGWTTPDDTSLVSQGAAAIRSLGSSIDTTTKNLNPSTTLGDIEYRSSTANTNSRLAIGTTGQVLTVSGGVPAWATVSSSPTSAGATVAARQGTSSTSYTDLTTSGPEVTLTTGTKVLVIVTSAFDNDNNAGQPGVMDFAISGATTRSASLTTAAKGPGVGLTETNALRYSTAIYLTGITAGSNTFTAKYRSWNGGTVYWKDREIFVMDMGS